MTSFLETTFPVALSLNLLLQHVTPLTITG